MKIRTSAYVPGRMVGGMRIKWQDGALAVALLVFGIGGTQFAARLQGAEPLDALAYVLIATAAAGLLFRSVRPLWTVGSTTVAIAVYLAQGYPFGPVLLSGVAAMYAVAVYARIELAAASALVYALAILPWWNDSLTSWITWSAGWILLPAAAGVLMKLRKKSVVDVRERTAISERLRLAQEVHDVVGHGLSVVAVQAGVALYVLDKDPAKARASLEAIRDTSKEALDGLRSELDTLRGSAPLAPAITLDDIPALAARMRDAGLEVSVEVAVAEIELPHTYQLAVYRIVQESLTNVLRHSSPGVTATVRVYAVRDELVVHVTDTGTPTTFTEGHGITGMRSRAEALGGTLEADASHGFTVIARIPLPS
ncbi:Signal transduction histidine kinase [Lentzea albidocapillata subsp. violacea]|uniref:histidine kinase n=2 Tax=Lentzea albidocapillata TaxID=40571 RepID=A0A1G9TLZ7_9PSEU|nr:Signal transduction histidine kinase [Lentzea albidocapillata subsp. violacea]